MAGKSDFQTVNTKIVVDPSGVKPGLDKASDSIKSFASNAKSHLNGFNLGALAGTGSPIESMKSALDGFMSKAAGLGGIFGPVGAGAAAALGAFAGMDHFIHAQHGRLLDLDKSAQRLGMTRLERGGFDVLFGKEGGENAAHAFLKMNKLVGEAALGNEEARKKLSHFGMTIDQALGQSQTKTIEQFSKAIAGIHSPAMRSAMAIELLGKTGAEYMPEIMKIAKVGLTEAQQFALEQGYIGSDQEVSDERAYKARQNRREIKSQGLSNRMAKTLGGGFGDMAGDSWLTMKWIAARNMSYVKDVFGLQNPGNSWDESVREESLDAKFEEMKKQRERMEALVDDKTQAMKAFNDRQTKIDELAADRWITGHEPPGNRLLRQLNEGQSLFDKGLLSKSQFDAGKLGITESLESLLKLTQPQSKLSGSLNPLIQNATVGSTEAVRNELIARHATDLGGRAVSEDKSILGNVNDRLGQVVEELKKQTRFLDDSYQLDKKRPNVTVANLDG